MSPHGAVECPHRVGQPQALHRQHPVVYEIRHSRVAKRDEEGARPRQRWGEVAHGRAPCCAAAAARLARRSQRGLRLGAACCGGGLAAATKRADEAAQPAGSAAGAAAAG